MSANLPIRPPTFYANGPSVLALPKGRLFGAAFTSVQKLGIKVGDDRTYHCTSEHKNVTARVVKARAIPQLVTLGIFNAGFCGIDLVREAGVEEQIISVADLGTDSVVIVAASDRPDTRWVELSGAPRQGRQGPQREVPHGRRPHTLPCAVPSRGLPSSARLRAHPGSPTKRARTHGEVGRKGH